MSPETKTQHWRRRGAELDKVRKAELCAMFRRLGYVGGLHPPEKWRKDEVINSIVDIEWGRLPEDQKLPTPPLMCPPCDECGGGQDAPAHRYGGAHHYTYTDDPDAEWVRADHEPPAEEQPTEANATPAVLEGGTGPGVLADQTRERPDVIPPALVPVGEPVHIQGSVFRPCEDCRTPITCEESGEDRCP